MAAESTSFPRNWRGSHHACCPVDVFPEHLRQIRRGTNLPGAPGAGGECLPAALRGLAGPTRSALRGRTRGAIAGPRRSLARPGGQAATTVAHTMAHGGLGGRRVESAEGSGQGVGTGRRAAAIAATGSVGAGLARGGAEDLDAWLEAVTAQATGLNSD